MIGLTEFYDVHCSPPLPVLLPESTGQGLQISAQLTRQDDQIFYSLLFENNSQVAIDGFMIQFNKNTFGLAAAGPLQVASFKVFLFGGSFIPCLKFLILMFYGLLGSTIATWDICKDTPADGYFPKYVSRSSKLTPSGCCKKQSTTSVVLQ